ncbi:Protein-tyrosine sulfotransferase [Lucilia cuprina]|uniref:Protein-tyrosine sulfotransferase n=1 Tax=Lucilia cuprina TaxID=7375 RepID=A0A0L0BKT2_LUCCU|nr:Protein-tyrosine sulfotransferase [Lucilia cuprina]KNC20700.1 Protein-tyrosine sulfotransferase [Lucilia cuprina]
MRLPYRNKKTTLWVMFAIVVVTMFLFKFTELRPMCFFRDESSPAASAAGQAMMVRGDEKYVEGDNQKVYSYNREMPLIFIGGVPRSGTTLMRAMLDAHPDVRCGQETRVIPRILQLRSHWLKSEKESLRLVEAGITKEVMNSAIAQFCLEIIAKHGDPAPRLCNKDPLTLKMGTYVIELFPNAKFLFMVRDGRATVHSIISRKVTITGFDLTSYRQCMQKWNHAIEVMHDQCKEIGKERCMMVYYEQLVLHPEEWMRKILDFLDVPWNDSVLHHEEFINKPGGVPLSKVERSSDQVIKPVNLEALSKWVGNIPEDVVRDMADIAPMLSVLGYDPFANPPDYGKPDAWVEDNTSKLRANRRLWENKAKEVLKMSPQQLKNSNTDEDDDNNINETFAPGNTNINTNNNNNNNNNNNHNINDNNNNNDNNQFHHPVNNNNADVIMQQHLQQQQQQLHEEMDQNNMQYEDINDINMLQQQQQQHQQRQHFTDKNVYRKPKDIITIRQLNTQSLKESI